MNKIIILVSTCLVLLSCTKLENPTGTYLTGSGVFIINEGNFRWGNGSLSLYSYDSTKIYNDLFEEINGRPLGDVPNSMTIFDSKAYIIVNNSEKIEVVDLTTLKSIETINGLISPRNMAIISNNKAYITSMYSDSIGILNLTDYSISGYINIRRSSEAIVVKENKAYVTNYIGGYEVMIIDTDNDQLIDSVEVGREPQSMVIDRNDKLWVLCNGGWTREVFAELDVINTSTNNLEKTIVFPTKQASPSCLSIDGKGETIYYLENGVQKMSIEEVTLPSAPLIGQSDHYFYNMAVNPVNGDILLTDAVDYSDKGFLIFYKSDGTLTKIESAGIIPGFMCFNLNQNFQAE